ncbi:MAG: STAS domain-containing protein [Candidatus Eisenbacteria bacterium]|uniref:STAS domain-containing protein n=1 Tax=Eiseniibacteriota bacterium TaxID=2212470 RepID=A0A937X7B1_UNCEI|nr:STAS domain-containing protein [Candidatus Eisenbacteria bacterium]
MVQLIPHWRPQGVTVWGRLTGHCGVDECRALQRLLLRMPLRPGSRVVLDLSAARHLHLRAVPRLIALAERLQDRGTRFDLVGLSAYLARIVELGGGLEGRDFLERHGLFGSPLPGSADPGAGRPARRGAAPGPHGLAAASLN